MKTRYLIRVYEVPYVREYPERGALDDIDEQTEDQLDPEKHFQFQLQGDSLEAVLHKLEKHI